MLKLQRKKAVIFFAGPLNESDEIQGIISSAVYVLDFSAMKVKAIKLMTVFIMKKRYNNVIRPGQNSERGATVIKFRNEEVINDVAKVIMKIADYFTTI